MSFIDSIRHICAAFSKPYTLDSVWWMVQARYWS